MQIPENVIDADKNEFDLGDSDWIKDGERKLVKHDAGLENYVSTFCWKTGVNTSFLKIKCKSAGKSFDTRATVSKCANFVFRNKLKSFCTSLLIFKETVH